MGIEGHLHEHISEFSIGLSLAFGALHALEPGHGKTALVTHLLTEKKSYYKPFVLALSTAVSHAASILLIAALAHGLLHVALHESENMAMVNRGLHFASGIVLVVLGIYIFHKIKKSAPRTHDYASCNCKHHRKYRSVAKPVSGKSWSTVAIGFAVGLVPCPSALIALSSAITSSHWISAALVVGAFSLGIFAALFSVGLLLGWKGAALFEKNSWIKKRPHLAQQIQGFVLLCVGLWHFSISLL